MIIFIRSVVSRPKTMSCVFLLTTHRVNKYLMKWFELGQVRNQSHSYRTTFKIYVKANHFRIYRCKFHNKHFSVRHSYEKRFSKIFSYTTLRLHLYRSTNDSNSYIHVSMKSIEVMLLFRSDDDVSVYRSRQHNFLFVFVTFPYEYL